MSNQKPKYGSLLLVLLTISSLIISVSSVGMIYADDESEREKKEDEKKGEEDKKEKEKQKKEQEKQRELEKKLKKEFEKETKSIEKFGKNLLKWEFDDDILESRNFADLILFGTVFLVIGVMGNTGYKIIKSKKAKTTK